MLTKNQQRKTGWNYLATLPFLICCIAFFSGNAQAKEQSLERVTNGNKVTFKGNEFVWRDSKTVAYDTIQVSDPITNEQSKKVVALDLPVAIISMNGSQVYLEENLDNKPYFLKDQLNFQLYLNKEVKEKMKNQTQNIGRIELINAVIDEEGKLQYYDVIYYGKDLSTQIPYDKNLKPVAESLDKIIENMPLFSPGVKDKKPVSTYQSKLCDIVM